MEKSRLERDVIQYFCRLFGSLLNTNNRKQNSTHCFLNETFFLEEMFFLNEKFEKIISLIWNITKAPKSGPVGHSPWSPWNLSCIPWNDSPQRPKRPPPVLSASGGLLLWGLVRAVVRVMLSPLLSIENESLSLQGILLALSFVVWLCFTLDFSLKFSGW